MRDSTETPTVVSTQSSKASGVSVASASQSGARAALVLLLLINLFNYIDRQILAAVEPEIRRHLLLSADAHDPNARAKMGLLSTAFLLTYMTIAPVFGLLAERYSRWLIVAIGVGLWSVASGASGLATTFAALLITRCFVGIGEAAYGPVAPTVIADLYPVASRGKVLAW
ncbi:MAG: MFS transporter, partial [Bacillota bacterium]